MSAQKTAVVTGASTGIGRETAKALAKQGYSVFMVSRDPGRAAAALEQVRAAASNGSTVHGITADLSLMSEARRVAAEVKSKATRLDALVNNAALVPGSRVVTKEGLEASFATNVMAPFILAEELQDLLKASAPSRIVNFVGGNESTFDIDDLQAAKLDFGDGFKVYGRTKNAVGLLTREQAKRLAGTGITVNGVLPGIVDTEGMRVIPGTFGFRVMMRLMRPFMKSSEQGAENPVWVSTAPELATVSGKFYGAPFGNGKKELTALSKVVMDAELPKRVYDACAALAAKA